MVWNNLILYKENHVICVFRREESDEIRILMVVALLSTCRINIEMIYYLGELKMHPES